MRVEYEPDTNLRDTETVPFTEPGGIEAFFRREVLSSVQRFSLIVGFENSLVGNPANRSAGARPG